MTGVTTIARGFSRQQMADRLAQEFQHRWIVNLGIGMPTLCGDADIGARDIIYHSENGVIGSGRVAEPDDVDRNLVNAGGQFVTLRPYAAIVHHADSFALIRSGRIDVTVLGAYEAASNGDFANWKMKGHKGGGIGGAMDLAVSAKRVFLMLDHTTRDGKPRLLAQCALPVTARGVVKLVMTNLGLFEPQGEYFAIREIAPGYSLDEVRAVTGCSVEPAASFVRDSDI